MGPIEVAQIASFGLAMVTFVVASFTRDKWRFDPLPMGLALWALAHLLNVWGGTQ